MTDLTFIADGNSDQVKSMPNLINFDKRLKTADKIREIQQFGTGEGYALVDVPELQNWIMGQWRDAERDAEVLYQRSLDLEPREREDEKMARLLYESGFI